MNNEIDIKSYFDAKFESLKEYFDVKFKNMDEKFDTLKIDNKAEHIRIETKLNELENRQNKLEQAKNKTAASFIQLVKETFAKWAIPTLLLLLVYTMSSGLLAKLLGIISCTP